MSQMNAVGWFDIFVDDLARATGFYETVLGRKLEPMDDPTGESEMMSFPAEMSAYGAGGALTKAAHGRPGVGGTIIYFMVEDCDQQMARIEDAGGQIVRPKFSIGAFGFVGLAMDSEGNMVGFNSMK
ncbi:VOC family protein [Roseobacteraceae bacterium S113]